MPTTSSLWLVCGAAIVSQGAGLHAASILDAPRIFQHNERALPAAPEEPVIFVHVPKTGGQTVANLIERHFARKSIYPQYFYYNYASKPGDDPQKYSLIRGHIFYAQLRNLHGKKVTFVREPVLRTLSEHRFWLRFNRGPNNNSLVRLHFLPPGDPLYVMSNHQCLFLSSYDPRDPAISIQQHLSSAIENLTNDFWFVGITEDLDNGIRTMFSKLGWDIPDKIPHTNSTKPTDETFSEELLEEIRQRNWADIQLYSVAKQLYETRFALKTPPTARAKGAKTPQGHRAPRPQTRTR